MAEPEFSMKLVVVGDGAVGKSCLLTRYRLNEFPEDYVPTVFENFVEKVQYKKTTINLQMWDTAGQEDFDRIRNRAYADTDVFLVCYAIDSPVSLENIETKWIPEITHFSPQSKIVLIGLKDDRRKDKGVECVETKAGEEMKTKIKANLFMECSSKTGHNVKEVFKSTIEVVKGRAEEKEREKGCIIC